jgi:hypothetical protein
MLTQKVQITLTPQEVNALSFKGKTLGYNVTKYIKYIITKEAFDAIEDFPQLLMSSSLEKKTIKALEEHNKGNSKKMNSLDDLDSL